MGQFSLNWFKSAKEKELEELKVQEQKLINLNLLQDMAIKLEKAGELPEEMEMGIKIIPKPYLNVKLVNDVLTVILTDGSILSKPNATVTDFQKVRGAINESEIFSVISTPEVVKEKARKDEEKNKLAFLIEGIDKLATISDFEVRDDSVYLAGINRTLPELLVEKFLDIIDRNEYYGGFSKEPLVDRLNVDEEYVALKRFFMWCCLNPRAEVAHELYRFLTENSFRITKQGFFVALRNVVTVNHGGAELVDFVSNSYTKVKAVWKKSPDNYHVFLENGEYKLVHTDHLTRTEVHTTTECYHCEGEGEIWNDYDEYEEDYGDESEHCIECDGTGKVEKRQYIRTIRVNHGKDLGTLTALYLDLPNMAENRYTDDWTKTFDIRVGKLVNMPQDECNWSTQDCAAAGLHFTADEINYVGCGDQAMLVIINPMKVVGIGEKKGRCYEYLPIMTVNRDEVTQLLHDGDFDTLEIDDAYAIRELADLETNATLGFSIESSKYQFNLPAISSVEIETITRSLQDMKNELSDRITIID
jgi:hypothetical protein